jgi:8-oxo-dGTP diphosphatase
MMRQRASVIIQTGTRILLIERFKQGRGPFFVLPGGGIDDGEHPETAARREVKEELGLNLEQLELVPGSPMQYQNHPRGNWIFRATLREAAEITWQEPHSQTATDTYKPVWIPRQSLTELKVLPENLASLI